MDEAEPGTLGTAVIAMRSGRQSATTSVTPPDGGLPDQPTQDATFRGRFGAMRDSLPHRWSRPARPSCSMRAAADSFVMRCHPADVERVEDCTFPQGMGPVGSRIANIGIELTDLPDVVAGVHAVTRVGTTSWSLSGTTVRSFGVSIGGRPRAPRDPEVPWP